MIKARKHTGLTQSQAAQCLGIKYPRLGAYEEGRADPPVYLLAEIIKLYRIEDITAFLSDYDFDMNGQAEINSNMSILEKNFHRAKPMIRNVVKILLKIEGD